MGHYPFEWQVQDFCPEDFIHFNKQFSKTVLQLIPFAEGPVSIIGSAGDIHEDLLALNKPNYWNRYIKRVLRQQRSALAFEKPILFLPVWNSDNIIGIAAIEGLDAQFAQVLSEEWLSDRSRIISREFFLQKQLAYEPVTGMFNDLHLHDTLDGLLSDGQQVNLKNNKKDINKSVLENVSLFLIEIYPRANNAEKALNYIVRAGYCLESFLGQDVLHHMGNGVFGLIGHDLDEEQAKLLGKNILSWFRREGFSRIHIGINTFEGSGETSSNQSSSEMIDSHTLLEQAWLALRKASRRGPYALCTFNSISNPETHPLKKIKPAVMAGLRKLWVDNDRFAILLISQDRELQEKFFSKRLLALIEAKAEAIPINESEAFVFLADADARKATSWAQDLKKKLTSALGTTYSIGIACFPCVDFNKSDIPQNGRKALLHASFFGPDTVTLFDGVSQNVSGDIYYGEGDLVRAVKEYRKGLEIEPTNTNLLNSLGEAYARMNKSRLARPFFEKILRSDPKHFMGLFNLGITYLTTGEDEQAIKYFEKTLSVLRRKRKIRQPNDLLLQLSKLYCRTGRYNKAITLLEKEKIMDEESSSAPGRDALLRYLGEAYWGRGRNDEAIFVLQRAVRYNPHDAYSLSLLGQLYAMQKQGNEIALSLCEEAVNIDDSHWKHWYCLAWVRFKMEQYESSLESLKECLRRESKSLEAMNLAGQTYGKLGRKSKATGMFQKVLKIAPGNKAAKAALKKMKIN
jgi:tetratricopeptide (TPR) repeat protein